MNYGHFDDATREYVITNPKTPVKWINYIGTLQFGGFVDNTGGALVCKGDPSYNRITRYIPQLPSSEFKGETLYLRVAKKQGYEILSPFFVPGLQPLDRYECRVGLGYMNLISECSGIRTEVLVFIPLDKSVEIRRITVTNISKEPKAVDCVPVVEYTHFDALKQFTNADWVPQTMQSRAMRQPDGGVILTQYAFMRRDTHLNYFTVNAKVSSFETSRVKFLGDNEYGSWAHPLSLDRGELSNYQANRGDNIAALLVSLGSLAPGRSVTVITQLGQEPSVRAIEESVKKYRDGAAVEGALSALADYWDGYLSKMNVDTPDVSMNRMLNVYNPRQCQITFNWSRYLSLYQLGYGNRELGFRDSAQDVMGIMDRAPEQGRGLLVKLLSVQRSNGAAMHQFNPLTLVAAVGESSERPDLPNYYSDDHLWIVLAVASYLKETGDLRFLDEIIPYYEKDPSGKPVHKGTVLDHLRRAVAFTRNDLGAHGLPLLGFADWNDTVNLKKGAESLFTACLYGRALREMIELAEFQNDTASAQDMTAAWETMKATFNAAAWDGKWYVRYFDHDGTPLGSHKNLYGKIYINSQSWSVLAGFAPRERAEAALQSVFSMLNTPKGIKLSTPGFNGFDPTRGGITTYPPGAKENGGIFLHTNPWVMIAEAMVGNGDRAYEYYRQINPVDKNDILDEFECEPYVYPQNILGDEHPQFGLARNSWLSGTSSWTYQAATKHILGIQPSYRGLVINPCIPASWDGYKAVRVFRNATYEIRVMNPGRRSSGTVTLTVDGKPSPDNVVPAFSDGKKHTVEATIS
jgi:cellobiose phosphorylase